MDPEAVIQMWMQRWVRLEANSIATVVINYVPPQVAYIFGITAAYLLSLTKITVFFLSI